MSKNTKQVKIHQTQLLPSEKIQIQYLLAKKAKTAFSNHSLEKASKRNVKKYFSDNYIQDLLENGNELVELSKVGNNVRVLVASTNFVKNMRLSVVFSLKNGEIVTMWMNSKKEYEKNVKSGKFDNPNSPEYSKNVSANDILAEIGIQL